MMQTMKHENAVGCLGVVADKKQMKILLEMINEGSLNKLLKESKLAIRGNQEYYRTFFEGCRICINDTLFYRDLAARNIFIETRTLR